MRTRSVSIWLLGSLHGDFPNMLVLLEGARKGLVSCRGSDGR